MNKKYLLVLFAAFFAVCINAQDTPAQLTKKTKKESIENVEMEIEAADVPTTGPKMEFTEMFVDYGVIEQNSEPLRVLNFVNTGTEPLVIKNCRGSCGCTVPEWPKEPIMPGEEAVINIRYATNRIGKFNKKVTITTNEEGSDPHVISVLGQVNKLEDEEGVPSSNPSMLNSGGK